MFHQYMEYGKVIEMANLGEVICPKCKERFLSQDRDEITECPKCGKKWKKQREASA